ncbi:helix-turn-helix transcriptional regulator [Wenxinia marina]|nr:HTH domain-containing protein [Wenxinia marina]
MASRSDTAARREAILRLMRDGRLWRAADLARRLGVSERTIWRDMERLTAAGLPVAGVRGLGYVATAEVALPAMHLTALEMEALSTALASLADTGGELGAAASGLLARIGAEGAEARGLGAAPLAREAGALPHLAPARAAIRARQVLRVTLDGETAEVRPLRLDYWGGLWALIAWSETAGDFTEVPLHRVEALAPLPRLFAEEADKGLEAYLSRPA